MSTGLNCEFFEFNPAEWYYALQNWTCPVGGDWMDDCSTYGPFKSYELADEHLHDNHANPGGAQLSPFRSEQLTHKNRKMYQRLVDSKISASRRPYKGWIAW